MSNDLQPGDRVIDLQAVTRAGGMFAGLVAAPVMTGLSGWWWLWCVLAAVAGGVVGFVTAGVVARFVFATPPGQAMVMRVGPAALGAALKAAVIGGLLISVACAVGAAIGAGAVAAVIALAAGVGASAGIGCLAAR